jgi:hypothetical protein
LVERKVTLLAALTVPAVLALKAATAGIPIVFLVAADPITLGQARGRGDRIASRKTGASPSEYCQQSDQRAARATDGTRGRVRG